LTVKVDSALPFVTVVPLEGSSVAMVDVASDEFFLEEWRGRTSSTRIRSEMQRREEKREGERAQRDEIYERERILRRRRVEGEVEVMSLFPWFSL
jgi:hypothetical protein